MHRCRHLLRILLACACVFGGGTREWAVTHADRQLSSLLLPASRCTIDRVHVDAISKTDFDTFYSERSPVILEGTNQEEFARATEREQLVRAHGQTTVTLSSANSISHRKIRMPLAKYLDIMRSQAQRKQGNETFYLFGPVQEVSRELSDVVKSYRPPDLSSPDLAFSFGIGAAGSGVPFHVHGQGWSEVVHGAKRWFLYPPNHRPPHDPDKSMLAWLQEDFPSYEGTHVQLLQQCDIGPSEVLYFPSMWWHAVINLSECVFMSSFERDTGSNAVKDMVEWL